MVYKTSKETQKRKDEKKKQLIKSAAKIFAERGYSGTTIKDIVIDSETSIGNFYFYFKNKEELFELLYDEMKDLLDQVSDFAFKKEIANTVEGFCRSKASELWAFQNYKSLARTLMIESAGLNPKFEKKRSEIFNNSNERIEQIFHRLKIQGNLNITDPRIYSVICNGTMYSVIMDWLQNNIPNKLTDYTFEIVTYNLNAFKLDYNDLNVKNYINDMIDELENNFKFF